MIQVEVIPLNARMEPIHLFWDFAKIVCLEKDPCIPDIRSVWRCSHDSPLYPWLGHTWAAVVPERRLTLFWAIAAPAVLSGSSLLRPSCFPDTCWIILSTKSPTFFFNYYFKKPVYYIFRGFQGERDKYVWNCLSEPQTGLFLFNCHLSASGMTTHYV